jgi:hypothetical protein
MHTDDLHSMGLFRPYLHMKGADVLTIGADTDFPSNAISHMLID